MDFGRQATMPLYTSLVYQLAGKGQFKRD